MISLGLLATACGNNSVPGDDCSASGTCPVDLATVPGQDDLLMPTCTPACANPLPYCNAAHQCVACLVDDNCPAGQLCKPVGGTTTCVPGCNDDARCNKGGGGGKLCCGNQCVDPATDLANCGACGTPCAPAHGVGQCAGGKCALTSCRTGYGDCNADATDGCEVPLHVDVNNCGMCNTKCSFAHGIPGCADTCYLAACQFGWDDCNGDPMDGCELNVSVDPKNCGACGNSCAGAPHSKGTCVVAACQLTCDQGWSDCNGNTMDGCERPTSADANNCGGCGKVCPQGLVCVNSSCTCPNCQLANAKTRCVNNQCVLDSCFPNWGDCDGNQANGCEVDLTSDAANCGACKMACPQNTPACQNSQCTNLICHPIGFNNCPSGKQTWCDAKAISGTDPTQAQKACSQCYNQNCVLQNGDCAGPGYSQNGGGGPTWGYQAGCSGAAGRVWAYGSSYTTYGMWAN